MMKRRLKKIFLTIVFILSIMMFALAIFVSNIIDLNGDKVVYLALDNEYHEKGFNIKYLNDDSFDVKITGDVDNTKVGEYKIKYETDVFGIKIKNYRTVEVVDEEAPTIELENGSDIKICAKDKYVEDGYKASDNYDGDLTDKVKVTEKDDVVIYKVSDSSGNSVEVRRYLDRNDTEKPELVLKGNSTYNIVVGAKCNDPGYDVKDNCSQDVDVKVEGIVDTSKTGSYELKYTAVDESGNATEVKRHVRVYEKEKYINNTGIIYLTFDDGPTSYSTPKILDILKKKNIKATFFVINHESSTNYLIKREYDEGHTVGLHSYTHNYKEIYSSKANFYNDMKKISDKVEGITGKKSLIIRFPGGSSNTISRKYQKGIMTELTSEVKSLGYRYYDWNVDSNDAGGAKNSDDVYRNVINGLKPNRSNIVLMHDFAKNDKTIGALEAIIDYGLANGYRFDKIDITTSMINHKVNN